MWLQGGQGMEAGDRFKLIWVPALQYRNRSSTRLIMQAYNSMCCPSDRPTTLDTLSILLYRPSVAITAYGSSGYAEAS